MNHKTPLEVVYEEIINTQDIDAVFRWIETYGFEYEKDHLQQMYDIGYEHAEDNIFYRYDDEYYRLYPNVYIKIYK